MRARVLGACSAFLAWIILLLFMRKFPSLGIYVVMFGDVLRTFLKFSMTFIMFVMAFGLGFYSLYHVKTFYVTNIYNVVVPGPVLVCGISHRFYMPMKIGLNRCFSLTVQHV